MPSQKQVAAALDLISKRAANYEYFFEKLADPEWITPLWEHGLLQNPPSLMRNEQGAIFGAPAWPPSKFLIRMASKAPKEVLDVALKIETDNYFVMTDLTEAALSMPGLYAEEWAIKLCRWIDKEQFPLGFLEHTVGKLISHLAKEGYPENAIKLALSILAVLPDPRAERVKISKENSEKLPFMRLEPQVRLRHYNYEQILKQNVPDLAKAVPFETLGMLCTLLEKFITYSMNDVENQKPKDLSYISRPAIEDHPQNHDHEIKGALITTIRDVTMDICKLDRNQINKVIEVVEKHEWNVFKRIGLHLLRVIEDAPLHLIEERLLRKDYFDSAGVHHEYYHLLKKYFGHLSTVEQDQILKWIEQAKKLKKRIDNDPELTIEQREKSFKGWTYKKLYPIQEYLAGEWKERFSRLKEEIGEPDIPPDFLSWMDSGWIGSKSPRAAEELSEMSMDELVDYLKNWRPSGDWMAPTPEGLGSALGSLVAEHPDKFAEDIDRFMDRNMDPTYVRHLISGFCQAIEKGIILPYELVFKLCKWVVDQPREISGRILPDGLRDDFEMDIDWQHTRQEITRLFEKIFDDKLKLPYELRNSAWQIIEVLTNDPDPDLEYEEKYGGKNSDPLHISINSIRGKALHGVMRYALWVCRQIKDDILEKERRSPSFQDIPEVRTVLEYHIDIKKCPFALNQTDRAVFGQWLPQIIHLDTQWVRSNIGWLFPKEKKHKHLRDALWNTYLLYSGLYKQVYDVINDIYRMEIENLVNRATEEDSQERAETRLVEHIIVLYAWEKINLSEDDLVSLFFQTAPAGLTSHAMDFIGRGLFGSNPPEGAIIDMYKTLWSWRVEKAGGIEKIPDVELAAFGWWFASGLCGDDWAFPYLEKTLERTDIEHSKEDVFEHMSSIFKVYPSQSLRCLRLFIDKNNDPWFLAYQKEGGVWEILKQGLSHEDSIVHIDAEDIIHMLGAKGYLQYRELLK